MDNDIDYIPLTNLLELVDWTIKYSKDARWDIISKCMNILESKYLNETTLLSSNMEKI